MKKSQLTGILGLSLLAVSTAVAQQPQQQGGQAGPSANENIRTLSKGTDVKLKLQDQISSQSNKSGDVIKATIDDNVKDGSGAVIFPEGAQAELQVVTTGSGLGLALQSITAVGQKYRLKTNPDYTSTGAQSGGASVSAGGGGVSVSGGGNLGGGAQRDTAPMGGPRDSVSGGLNAGRDTARVSGGVGIGAGGDTASVSGGVGAGAGRDSAGVSGGAGVQGGNNPQGGISAQGGMGAQGGAGVQAGGGVSGQQGGVSAQAGAGVQNGGPRVWNIFKDQDGLGVVSGVKEPPVGGDFVIPPGTTVKFKFEQPVTVVSG